jgi:serine/threonine protein kinase
LIGGDSTKSSKVLSFERTSLSLGRKISDLINNVSHSQPSKRQSIADKQRATKQLRRKAKREQSPVVISRLYRSPEVILHEKDYGKATDVWSLGCVFAEILACLDK